MLIESDKMVSITKFQKEMTQRIRELQNTKRELYVLKNNVVAAVLLDPDEYCRLKEMEEMFEQSAIANLVTERMT
ncbi:MAG: type II toxin-antitoxin system Phd/YefM family antitoxin, partial [Atribacterota bacterium]